MRSGPHIKEPRAHENGGAREGAPGFRPLYRQVRDVLVKRIVDGVWRPGETLPSETDIASHLRVSQGTVRKALNELAEENFVVRRQGKGTFVARHDEARILFQFFKLTPDNGMSEFPDSRILSVAVESADAGAAEALALRTGNRVVRIERLRSLAGRICILERIALPRALFPDIEKRDLPNNLYELYRSVFGVTVVRAQEKLKAVTAAKRDAKVLGLFAGVPLLSIDRRAFAADGRPVEQRLSLCHTDALHYFSDLS
ncbi:MAG: GntR family transcriptional regulator [Bradyrhizobiaceae bacterium]|nr:GntR family transcriptional regulator [Bradyrhizobiaceae bacterium]